MKVNFLLVGQHWCIHRKTSLVCSCPYFSRWPCSCCFVGCCFHDLLKTAYNSHVAFSPIALLVQVLQLCNSTNMTTAQKNSRFKCPPTSHVLDRELNSWISVKFKKALSMLKVKAILHLLRVLIWICISAILKIEFLSFLISWLQI